MSVYHIVGIAASAMFEERNNYSMRLVMALAE
jgi:hypothetical protein